MSRDVLVNVIDPALAELALSGVRVTDAARAMLYATGLQESNLTARFQEGEGRGLWRMCADDVGRVLAGGSTQKWSEAAAGKHVGAVSPHAVWAALEHNDVLAAIFARLLLWPDSAALPAPAAAGEQVAWDYYVRCWRPNPPRQQSWAANWRAAVEIVGKNGLSALLNPPPQAAVAVSTGNGRRGLSALHPQVRAKAERLMELCREKGLPILITDTWRSKEEQDALFDQGKVTKVKYPYSAHCWGVAFDFCRNKRGSEFDNNDKFFDKVGEHGKSVGLFWGGDFKSFPDRPHFEDTEFMVGNSAQTLINKWGTPEKFRESWGG